MNKIEFAGMLTKEFKDLIEYMILLYKKDAVLQALDCKDKKEFLEKKMQIILQELIKQNITPEMIKDARLRLGNQIIKPEFPLRVVNILNLCLQSNVENHDYKALFARLQNEAYQRKYNSHDASKQCVKLYNVGIELCKQGIDILEATFDKIKDCFINAVNKVFNGLSVLLPVPEKLLSLPHAKKTNDEQKRIDDALDKIHMILDIKRKIPRKA
jgi:hypothetical protein